MTIRPRLPAPSSGMRRTVLRLGTPLAGALGLLLVGTEPAFAQSASGSAPLGFWKTVLIFVVVPLALFGAIGLLVFLPGLLRRPRYRPGRPWEHEPLWFGGPEDPAAATAAVHTPEPGKGGASAEW